MYRSELRFFRRWRDLPRLIHESSGDSVRSHDYVNISPRLANVVHHGRATLWELKHRYSLEDVFWMEEVDYIPEYNQARAAQVRIRRAKNRKIMGK